MDITDAPEVRHLGARKRPARPRNLVLATMTRNGKVDVRDFNRPAEAAEIYRRLGLTVGFENDQPYGIGLIHSSQNKHGRDDVHGVVIRNLIIAELAIEVLSGSYTVPNSPTHSVAWFWVADDHRGYGWATRLFDAVVPNLVEDQNVCFSHGGQTRLGEAWWKSYCATHKVDASRHLDATYSPGVDADLATHVTAHPFPASSQDARGLWGRARREGLNDRHSSTTRPLASDLQEWGPYDLRHAASFDSQDPGPSDSFEL